MAKITKASLEDVRQDSLNLNKHAERGSALTRKSIEKFGARLAGVVDRNGVIIDGNDRQIAFGEAELNEIEIIEADPSRPVYLRFADLDLADPTNPARELQLALHRSAVESFTIDAENLLAAMNEGTKTDDWLMQDELDTLLAGLVTPEPVVDPGADISKAAVLQEKWQVKTGDLFVLDSEKGFAHRLICGDCTDSETVDRLMQGEKADMVFTDPPYNVSYQADESIESLKARNRRTDLLVVENDSMTDEQFDVFLDSFLSKIPLKMGGAYYLCAPAGRTETRFRNALDRSKVYPIRECIVWVKDRFVFGRQDYHWRHESILYGWREGASHFFIDDHTQDTVWEIVRPTNSEFHPTMKPVELPMRAISNSSRSKEIVYEPFSGSGTTLLACESLGRQARCIEIAEAYVAVCLERWSLATNTQPVRVA